MDITSLGDEAGGGGLYYMVFRGCSAGFWSFLSFLMFFEVSEGLGGSGGPPGASPGLPGAGRP